MESPRFWVALPGRGKAVEMTRAELEEKKKRGDLPAGTLVARFGTKDWVDVAKLDEVIAQGDRTSLEAPPPSSIHAAQGVDAFELPPEIAPTIAGEEAPPLPPLEPKKEAPVESPDEAPKRSRTLIVALASALVAILISSTVLYAWLRYGYARGAVLEHVPADCKRLEYVDFSGIDGSSPVKALLGKRDKALQDWLEDLDDEDGFRRSQDEDAKGRASTARTLKRLGLRPYGDVKEVAFCELKEGDETERLVVIGGTLRGKDLLVAIREAIMHRDRKVKDEQLAIEEYDGHDVLRLDETRSITMASSQVAIIGKRKIAVRYLGSKPTMRVYGIRDGEVIVRRWATADKGLENEERYAIKGDKLVVTKIVVGVKEDQKAVKDRLVAAGEKIRRLDGYEAIADAYDAADIKIAGDEVRTELVWPLKDVGKAVKQLMDADRREMRNVSDAMKFAPGTEFFHHVVLPGVDYFDLRLSPW
ncbi:MAG: hypothetical protein ACXWUG_01925 [Polyangiales bacterium]